MRRLALMLLGCCGVACSVPPGGAPQPSEEGEGVGVSVGEDAAVAEVERGDTQDSVVSESALAVGSEDQLLARARSHVRGGRVSEAVRRELLESKDANHRHAARLLQAIAGEPPAAVIARTRGPVLAVEVAAVDQLFEPEAEVEARPPEQSEPPKQAEPPKPAEPPKQAEPPGIAVELDEPIDRPPKLSSLPPDSPAWHWFVGTPVYVEAEPQPVSAELRIDTASLVGPLPLLLRERPPTPVAAQPSKADAPRLVILTSLALRPGASANQLTLELAGAGAARMHVQPLTGSSVRLLVHDAGAVPSFLSARPSAPGVEVVDVARYDRTLEIEVELAPGWTLQRIASLPNGASVQFSGNE